MDRIIRNNKRVKPTKDVSDSDSDNKPIKKPKLKNNKPGKKLSYDSSSSSESDIESYLKPADKINIEDFNIPKPDNVKTEVKTDISTISGNLSDSSDSEGAVPNKTIKDEPLSTKIELETTTADPALQFNQFTQQIEDAKKSIQQYENKKKIEIDKKEDISNLLAAGEKQFLEEHSNDLKDLHSSDFESCDSEKEDWEEIKGKEIKEEVRKHGVEITIGSSDIVKKKKGTDILAALKRRLNRKRKEMQVSIHKVHLLCWIAHGNYVNGIISSPEVLAMALSLIPSEKSYPDGRPDLKYLEQIVKWFKQKVDIIDKPAPKNQALEELLQNQMSKKQTYGKKMFYYVFIAIVRALGIKCRLVLSFQVEPLRPPASELHSESSKSPKETVKSKPKLENLKKVTSTSSQKTSKPKTKPKIGARNIKNKPASSDDDIVHLPKNISKDGKAANVKVEEAVKSENSTKKSEQDSSKKKSINAPNLKKLSENTSKTRSTRSSTPSITRDEKAPNLAKLSAKGAAKKSDNGSLAPKASGSRSKSLVENNEKPRKSIGRATKTNEKVEANEKLTPKPSRSRSSTPNTPKITAGKSTKNTKLTDKATKNNKKVEANEKLTPKPSRGRSKSPNIDINEKTEKNTKTRKSIARTDEKASKSNAAKKPEPRLSVTRPTTRSNTPTITITNENGKEASKKAAKSTKQTRSRSVTPNLSEGKNSLSGRKKKVPQLDGNFDSRASESDEPMELSDVDSEESETDEEFISDLVDSILQLDGGNDDSKKRSSRVNLNKLRKQSAVDDDAGNNESTSDVKNDIIEIVKSGIKQEKEVGRYKLAGQKHKSVSYSDSDSDFTSEPPKKSKESTASDESISRPRRRVQVKQPKVEKIFSDESNDEEDPFQTSGSDSDFAPESKKKQNKNKKSQESSDDDISSDEEIPSDEDIPSDDLESDEETVPRGKKRVQVKKSTQKRSFSRHSGSSLGSKIARERVGVPKSKSADKNVSCENHRRPKVGWRDIKLDRKVLSDDEEITKPKKGNDVWCEVFLDAEEKWISVDLTLGMVHCVEKLYSRASHPVNYVVAWDNDNKLKDITKRYCKNFSTVTRKIRTEETWWEETLLPFLGPKNARDKEEDDDLNRQQLDQPLPTSIGDYKNHPLYVLQRHLLKFQALYPPNPPTLGFIRNEAVYPRSCVYTLHSRDIWLKSAKTVKPKEEPYKIVKGRPKYDKLSNAKKEGEMLEIFGEWQVQDYDPPTAENGKVPRNAFGNVDLFKPSMLPKKCVHLQLPGLNRISKKLNIDCASAIVGFDFHGGWSHPVYDGFVVCEEFEDTLVAAWELDREEMERKEEEKIEKRVYDNWKKLIKGLLIRERLKARYDFGEASKEPKKPKPSKKAK